MFAGSEAMADSLADQRRRVDLSQRVFTAEAHTCPSTCSSVGAREEKISVRQDGEVTTICNVRPKAIKQMANTAEEKPRHQARELKVQAMWRPAGKSGRTLKLDLDQAGSQ